jgi:uncharacterized protein YwbE
MIAARDDQLLSIATLKSIQRVGKLTRGGLARQQLIKANTQIHGTSVAVNDIDVIGAIGRIASVGVGNGVLYSDFRESVRGA